MTLRNASLISCTTLQCFSTELGLYAENESTIFSAHCSEFVQLCSIATSSLSESPSNLNDIGPIESVNTLHFLHPSNAQTPSLKSISVPHIFLFNVLPPRSQVRDTKFRYLSLQDLRFPEVNIHQSPSQILNYLSTQ